MSNEQSKSPLDHFLDWFASLPPTHQSDIAGSAMFMPGFAFDLSVPNAVDRFASLFVERVHLYKVGGARERGAAIALNCSLEQQALVGRGEGNWRRQEANLRELADRLGNEQFHARADALQFADAQWAATRAKWNELIAGPFSIEAITRYRRDE